MNQTAEADTPPATDSIVYALGGPDRPTGQAAPGDLMRLVAKGLTSFGFDVQHPEYEDERRLTITAPPGMGCSITVDDCGAVEWAYWPRPGHRAEPGQITHMALTVLAPGDDHSRRTIPTEDMRRDVGRELRAAGLDVDLDVYADQDTFKVIAEIVAANRSHPECGQIRVGDDGRITWECVYDADTITPPAIAETVVNILSRELAARPWPGQSPS